MKRRLNNKGQGRRFIVRSRASSSFLMAAQMDSVLAQSLWAKHESLSLKNYELKVQMIWDAETKQKEQKEIPGRGDDVFLSSLQNNFRLMFHHMLQCLLHVIINRYEAQEPCPCFWVQERFQNQSKRNCSERSCYNCYKSTFLKCINIDTIHSRYYISSILYFFWTYIALLI